MRVPPFYITEDGEAVGTLRWFSTRFRLTPASALECLRHRGEEAVVMEAGQGRSRFLVVSAEGLAALSDCASVPLRPGSPSSENRS